MLIAIAVAALSLAPIPESGARSLYDFEAVSIQEKKVPLAEYRGNVVMVVNVASRCGLTPQYADLEDLYRKYKDKGFVILGFPANNFGNQEPGSNEEILEFCTENYGVTFPMFSKVSVVGEDTHPLFTWLISDTDNREIAWNFTKFLLDRNGNVVTRFEPRVRPSDPTVIEQIERLLG